MQKLKSLRRLSVKDDSDRFQFFYLTSGLNTVNAGMLMCVACGNGSFEYRIEPSKTRRRRLC